MIARTLFPRAITGAAFVYKGRRGWASLRARSPLPTGRNAFYREIWDEAAASLGAPISVLNGPLMEIRAGDLRIRVVENYTSLDDPVTLRVAGDKPLVHRLLGERGVPTPAHAVFPAGDALAAWRSAQRLGIPLVVKPARGTGAGGGVTAGVADRRSLLRAMALAGSFCPEVVIEHQVEGANYRLLYLDGELLDAVRRRPPEVVGDGTSTARHLIEVENRERVRGGFATAPTLITPDWEVRQTLRAQGYSLRSVPSAGARVRLKTVVSDNRRRDNTPATTELTPAVVASGARAAAAVGVRLAGVDLITPDPSVGLEEAGGVVLEVNTTPGLHFHYPTPEGARPVAALILERLMTGPA